MSDDASRRNDPPPTTRTDETDRRKPWQVPVLVDRGSIFDVVRSTTGPVSDGMAILMMP